MGDPDIPLIYAHIGDLHLTREDAENHRDFLLIVEAIARDLAGLDFVYLPGDNADNGTPEQYALVRRAIERLPMPVHVVTGDHDMEPGSLDNFYGALGAAPLPKAVEAKGVRCLFLDICGPGSGGPDFRVGAEQAAWLAAELGQAAARGQRCAIFMHSYPADLRGAGETSAINAAFAVPEVLLVDMGHTHYNELTNDGRTIYSATRSTGQIEEGPVGYSIVTIDRRTVSWRFRALAEKGPIVLITAPADFRLATDPGDADHMPGETCELRATVLWSRKIVHCSCGVDDGPDTAMREVAPGRYVAMLKIPAGATSVGVEARDADGWHGIESIEIARHAHLAVDRRGDGSDADTIGAWEARGICGTQLGPNRNGRKW